MKNVSTLCNLCNEIIEMTKFNKNLTIASRRGRRSVIDPLLLEQEQLVGWVRQLKGELVRQVTKMDLLDRLVVEPVVLVKKNPSEIVMYSVKPQLVTEPVEDVEPVQPGVEVELFP